MTFKHYTILISVIFSLSLLSCATGSQPVLTRGVNVEALVREAGFVRHEADTPEKIERVRAEVQRKVIPVQEDGQTYYLYADADFCQCLYVGDEPAFRRFEELMYRKKLERNSCIDDRLRSTQVEPWREFGALGGLCSDGP